VSEYTEFMADNPQDKPLPKPPEPAKLAEHFHIWDILEVWIPNEVEYHPRIMSAPKTITLLMCKVCHLPYTTQLNGKWSLQQLRRAQMAHEQENEKRNE
jgi:hypothetical protein